MSNISAICMCAKMINRLLECAKSAWSKSHMSKIFCIDIMDEEMFDISVVTIFIIIIMH